MLSQILTPSLFAAMMRISTPITLAAMGGLLCQKAGVFNIALDGMMLMGSFFGIVGVYACNGNILMGYFLAIFCTVLLSLLYGFVGIKLKANLIYTGLAINTLSLGLTSFILNAFFNMAGSLRPANINSLPKIQIPFLEKIPILSEIIVGQDMMVLITLIIVICISIIASKTKFGMAMESVGRHPDAARTSGINPERIQMTTVVLSGILCGLAGAHLSCDIVSEFSENMVQGRGFTAFTAVAFGNANPVLTFIASLLFGFSSALGTKIELAAVGIPSSLVNTFPYLLCIVALAFSTSIARKNERRSYLNPDKTIKAVVFDMDGVICKSEKAFVAAINKALEIYNIHPTPADYRKFSGACDDEFIGAVTRKYGVEYNPAMKAEAYRNYEEVGKELIEKIDGVEKLISSFRKKGLKIAIGSSADRRKISASLKAIGLDENIFDIIVSAEDVQNAKPAPDIFIFAAQGLGILPEECVALDDSPLGIIGAKTAGMKTIAVLTDRKSTEFDSSDPTFIVETTSECKKWVLSRAAK